MKAKVLLEQDENLYKLLEYDKENDKDKNDLVTLRDSKKNSPC